MFMSIDRKIVKVNHSSNVSSVKQNESKRHYFISYFILICKSDTYVYNLRSIFMRPKKALIEVAWPFQGWPFKYTSAVYSKAYHPQLQLLQVFIIYQSEHKATNEILN